MILTEVMAAEHANLLKWFDQVEAVLPRLTSRTDVSALAALVGGVLTNLGELESEFAFVPLDSTRRRTGEVMRHAQQHHEIGRQLAEVRQAGTYHEACRRLQAALRALREHLREEERSLFPVIEGTLKPKDLVALGKAFNGSRRSRWKGAQPFVEGLPARTAEAAAAPPKRATPGVEPDPFPATFHYNDGEYNNVPMSLSTKTSRKQTFRITAPQAKRVLLVGDFTQWEKQGIPLQHEGSGVWATTVDLPPGKHTYRFVVDGAWCDDPECKERVPNPFGGHDMIREAA